MIGVFKSIFKLYLFDMQIAKVYNVQRFYKGDHMHKKFYIFIAIILCLACFAPTTSAYAMPYFEDATVTGDEVNMRMRPSTDSPVIMQLNEGTRIGVFCEEQEGWYRIIYGNYRGYISKEYVFLPSTDYMVAHVLEGGLKLRQNPGTYSNVIMKLDVGTGVTVRNFAGDWYLVDVEQTSDDGKVTVVNGYLHKDYVKMSSSKQASNLLKIGMSGVQVRNMQQELRKRNFLIAPATGYFGDVTEGAVKAFQRKAGLSQDGIVGAKTYEMIFGDNNISTTTAELFGITGEVKLSTWDDIAKVFRKGKKALVTDVRTGKQFWVKRFGGWWHADVEPLTAKDTAIMKECYGGRWSWDRRAIWVTIGSKTYAASQNGMPHLSSPIGGNNFDGHFCIHFKDSKVHQTGRECPRHQAQVRYAYKKGR